MRLTISKLPLAEACPSSVLGGPTEVSSRVHESSAVGSTIHTYLARVAEVGQIQALAEVPPQHLEACSRINLDKLPSSTSYAHEVPFAINPYDWTARELPGRSGGKRDYSSVAAHELAGTADLVGVGENEVVVLDVKTGFGRLGRPSQSLQLAAYALAAGAAWGKEEFTVGWIRLIDGEPKLEVEYMSDADIDSAMARIEDIWTLYRRGTEAFREGTHCRYCQRFGSCPAKVALLRGWEMPALTTENAGEVLERLEATEAVLKRVREALESFAVVHPFRTKDGYEFCEKTKGRQRIDVEKALEVLPLDIGARAVTQELTKASLRRVCGSSSVFKAMMTRLEHAGAVETTSFLKVERRRLTAAELPLPTQVVDEDEP